MLSFSDMLWVVLPGLCVLGLCLRGWSWLLYCQRQGKPAVPYEPRKRVPWGLIDLVLVFLIVIVVPSIIAPLLPKARSAVAVGVAAGAASGGIVDADLGLDDFAIVQIGSFALSALCISLISLALLRWRCRASGRDFGLPLTARDIRLGIVAFAMLLVPVLFLQFLLVQLVESQHPLIESLLENPSDALFAVTGFTAVIAAPIFEEFLFRVYLQGWLENLAVIRRQRSSGTSYPADYPWRIFWGGGTREDDEPHDPSADRADTLPDDGTSAMTLTMRPRWWPIFASSALFAGAHFGHGPDPIPLFFLALGLGYLYQRTHRVWPSIIAHSLFNLTSFYVLWFNLRMQDA